MYLDQSDTPPTIQHPKRVSHPTGPTVLGHMSLAALSAPWHNFREFLLVAVDDV